jgi:predicted flap endonuclease-1-like 5' DNA nuclease
MPAAKALPQFEAFGAYVDPFGASQTALSVWIGAWRAGVDAAFWWTERWLETVSAFTPSAPVAHDPAVAPAVVRPVAAVIDLAQAAAARIAADVSDVAEPAVEIAETVTDASVSIAQDAVSVVEHAAAAAADVPDDLTRLVGIGPKLSIALAERGVTRFAQIALWSEADLAEIDKALDLKGRAVRDAWVAQAKRFSAEA